MPSSTTVKPRKRPAQARSEATVTAIVEAAAHILEADGLTGFNTNKVAERAGVSIGSLYQYFATKRAILAEIMRRERGQMLKDMQEAEVASRDAPLEEQVRALTGAAADHQFTRPGLSRILETSEADIQLDDESLESKRAIVALVAALLKRHGFANEDVRAQDIVALARGMVDAAGMAGETDKNAVVDRVCRAILGYLKQGEE